MTMTIPSGREIWFNDAAATFHTPVDKVLPPETMENAQAIFGTAVIHGGAALNPGTG